MSRTDPVVREATREISYATSAQTRAGRTLIRTIENATGRLGLIARADGYQDEVAAGADFWAVMAARYGLSLAPLAGDCGAIPATGPLVVIANHPFGILDGLMLGLMLSRRRGPDGFRILAHRIFRRAPEIDRIILPISFDGTPEAQRTNIATRAEAGRFLAGGGAIGIFPGGTVSTAARPFGPALDPGWRRFTAKLIARSGATVVPVFFDGANSRLFQIASHVSPTLRLSLLIREFRRRTDRPVPVVIGAPIPPDVIAAQAGDPARLMDFLRRQTYALSPRPMVPLGLGHEFEVHHRTPEQRRGRGGLY